MGKINSRAKGCRGELELAHEIKERFGWKARRTQQYCGASEDASSDVVVAELPQVHLEVKRTERLNVALAFQQALRDATLAGKLPVLFHKKNRQPWMVTYRLEDLIQVAEQVMAASTMRMGQSETQSQKDLT